MFLLRAVWSLVIVVVVCGALVLIFNVRLFVVQPIGALPNGGAVLLYDRPTLRLIDSPDAICQRTQGGVSLLCRGAALGVIGDGSTILLRLPYSDWLYSLSGAPRVDR